MPGTRGQGGHGGEGLEVGDFRAPHLAGHLARGVVNHGVTGPVQPTDRLLVQVLDGAVRPVQQEVSLDVLDRVFNPSPCSGSPGRQKTGLKGRFFR